MTDDQTPQQVNVNVNQSEPSVRITLTTIYGQQLRMENVLTGLLAKVEEGNRWDDKVEGRVKDLENAGFVTRAQAAWAFGALVSVVIAVSTVWSSFR